MLSPSTLLRLPAALHGAGPVLSAVPVFGYSTKARIQLRLCFVPSPASAVQAARGLGALSRDAACLFPPRPQRALPVGCLRLASVQRSWPLASPSWRWMSTIQNLRKSLDRNRGPVCSVGGGASLGLSLPLSPPPCLLPPAGMGRLFSGVSQSLCFANRRQCVRAG